MVASHEIRLPIATICRHLLDALALVLLLLAADPAAAETGCSTAFAPPADSFQAPLVPPSGSTAAVVFRTGAADALVDQAYTTHPATDPFDQADAAAPLDQAAFQPAQEVVGPSMDNNGESLPPPSCDAATEKPLGDLTINVQLPAGLLPRDHATECWPEIAGPAVPGGMVRCWPVLSYHWRPTCLAYRPLYFEEINLERHGYGLGDCCQPVASGAHFFGSFLALPYLMAVDCPGECIYTLGHYRPGSCPPWRHHCPGPHCLGTLAEAGTIAGLILLIP